MAPSTLLVLVALAACLLSAAALPAKKIVPAKKRYPVALTKLHPPPPPPPGSHFKPPQTIVDVRSSGPLLLTTSIITEWYDQEAKKRLAHYVVVAHNKGPSDIHALQLYAQGLRPVKLTTRRTQWGYQVTAVKGNKYVLTIPGGYMPLFKGADLELGYIQTAGPLAAISVAYVA